MLTVEKIRLYKKFRGDVDSLSRSNNNKIKQLISEDDFFVIESLIQDSHLISKNLASKTYANNFVKKIEELCDKNEIPEVLVELQK